MGLFLSSTQTKTEDASKAARDIGLAFVSSIGQAISGDRGFSDVLKSLQADLLKLGTRKLVTEPFLEWLSPTHPGGEPGSTGGGLGQIFGSIFKTIGFRANGGPVFAGSPYIVGERGPEFFVPKQSGTIVPNGATMGGIVVNVNV